jgi:hypothetical protein
MPARDDVGAYERERKKEKSSENIDMMCGLLIATLLAVIGRSQSNGESRYVVTAAPLGVGVPAKLCLAVDPADVHGVWWWESGKNGCANRSTGPGVFTADSATVSRNNGAIEAAFRLPLHAKVGERDSLDVRLTIEGGQMRSSTSVEGVPVTTRRDLDIPER